MHNPAPVLEIDSHKLLWDFDIQTDHLILARRPDLIIINNNKKKKENLQNCRLCRPGGPQNKSVEHESDDCANCDWCARHNKERIIKRLGGLGSWRSGWDYPNDSIAKTGQNPETSPGDLRRLAVTQTPVKTHQLTLMWKTRKKKNNNNKREHVE